LFLLLSVLAGALSFVQAVPPAASGQTAFLPIDLLGVVFNQSSPERCVCLLRSSASNGSPVLAQPGDTVFQLAVVQAIVGEDVFLKNLATGRIEILSIPKPARSARMPALAPALPRAAPNAPPDTERVIPKSVVDHYRANLREFLDAATAAPRLRTVKGRSVIDGFEIRSVKKGSIVDQLGFQAGDVILEINGAKLDGPDKVLSVYQASRDSARVVITVLRDGKTRTLAFSQK